MTSAVASPPPRNAPCPCGSGKRYKDCHGALRPTAATWVERALEQLQARDFTAAEASLHQALRLAPQEPRIFANFGTVYVGEGRYADAEAALTRAFDLAPDDPYVLTLLAHTRQLRCAWAGLGELHAHIRSLLDRSARSRGSEFNPFPILSMPTSPAQQLAVSKRYARSISAHTPTRPIAASYGSGGRLRVGFTSSDFRAHPMMTLMLEFWERIDRGRIHGFGYGIMARSGGPVGQRAERAFEHFIDVSVEPVERIAQRIRDDRIAILFDLNGYTTDARPPIFALRPAPVQVNCIGFAGTLGAPWYDYIFTDRFCLPEHLRGCYSEQPLYMPHMSYPSDTTRLAPGPPPVRAACGLPERGFVFCCFNYAYKILPEVFAIWMRLLAAVPGSVLWLLEANAEAKSNLQREAQRAGIASERLIFAPRVSEGEHVARNAVADLFLDTYPYGAHTTANDALLAGLPLLTCAGETMASRIAGSQLQAIGLPELITESFDDYEALALKLATEPGLLAGYRQRLAANRRTHPLFDMARYARDFEDAMQQVWDDCLSRP